MNESGLSVRVNPANLNHHLWNNNGTWFIHYTRHEPDFTKLRVRQSLETRDIRVARARRDDIIGQNATCRSGNPALHTSGQLYKD